MSIMCSVKYNVIWFWKLWTQHILEIHNGSPYKCEHCRKTFRNPETYHRHLYDRHTGKNYKCNVLGCDLIFDTRNKLKRHLMHKHKDNISLWKPIGTVSSNYCSVDGALFQEPTLLLVESSKILINSNLYKLVTNATLDVSEWIH